MPNCKKCSSYFPVKLKVGGKIKNLQNRKYCLICSPYKQHNTKKLEIKKIDIEIEIKCIGCSRVYVYNRKRGHNKTKCNSCVANGRRQRVKQKCVDYKGSKCVICNYSKCNRAMVFHHKDNAEKDFPINYAMSLSWNKIKKELDKCILLCNRCHMELHDGIINAPVTQR